MTDGRPLFTAGQRVVWDRGHWIADYVLGEVRRDLFGGTLVRLDTDDGDNYWMAVESYSAPLDGAGEPILQLVGRAAIPPPR